MDKTNKIAGKTGRGNEENRRKQVKVKKRKRKNGK